MRTRRIAKSTAEVHSWEQLTRLLGWGKQDDGFDGDFPMPDDPVEPPMTEETEA